MKNISKGIVRLNGRKICEEPFSCTGLQLVRICEALQEIMLKCQWFIADISTNDGRVPFFIDEQDPKYIATTKDLIDFSLLIDQYFSGIFLAVPDSIKPLHWNRYFDTEDEPTENLQDAILEIRAFDTSYFEIYSSELEILQLLSEHFKVPIELTEISGFTNFP